MLENIFSRAIAEGKPKILHIIIWLAYSYQILRFRIQNGGTCNSFPVSGLSHRARVKHDGVIDLNGHLSMRMT